MINSIVCKEKQRRLQIYNFKNMLLKKLSLFDFCSKETIQILNQCFLLDKLKQEKIEGDHLFISFFIVQSSLLETLSEVLPELTNRYKKFRVIKGTTNSGNIPYSYKMKSFLQDLVENTRIRFKTLIVTPEILFITFMESEEYSANNSFKSSIKDHMTWAILRYKLLKSIYSTEIDVRTKINKSQRYFAYLLKCELPGLFFERVLKSNVGYYITNFFRGLLMWEIKKHSFLSILKQDIYLSQYIN